jgi:hypothetical protein
MKTLCLVLLFLIRPALLAQGTLSFHADLIPISSAPPGTPAGSAHFYVVTTTDGKESRLAGVAEADFDPTIKIVFARVDTASGIVFPALDISPFCASTGGGGRCEWSAEWSFMQYTDAMIGELQRGEWRISLGLETSPDAIITGQLQVVPEPSALLLIELGLVPLLVFRLKRRPA